MDIKTVIDTLEIMGLSKERLVSTEGGLEAINEAVAILRKVVAMPKKDESGPAPYAKVISYKISKIVASSSVGPDIPWFTVFAGHVSEQSVMGYLVAHNGNALTRCVLTVDGQEATHWYDFNDECWRDICNRKLPY